MAAKICIVDVPVPEYDFKMVRANDEKYKKDVEAKIRALGYDDKYTGKTIKFGVGDGYAVYMVATVKPLTLIHLQLVDTWSFQYAHLLTVPEVKKQIDSVKE